LAITVAISDGAGVPGGVDMPRGVGVSGGGYDGCVGVSIGD